MNLCFRQPGVYTVRVSDCQDRDLLLKTATHLEIPVKEAYYSMKPETRSTNVFAADVDHRILEYMGEPHICAAMASSGIRFYTALEFAQLAKYHFPRMTRCPIFHIPHDGNQFPKELMESVCVSEEQFELYHERMRDIGVSLMIPSAYRTQSQTVRFPVSRLLCDVERFLGPEEVMERYGMGFCYEKAFDGTKIKNVNDTLKEKTLVHYQGHHLRMDQMCRTHKRTLIFDLHSYSDEIVPDAFLTPEIPTPDVCIGIDKRFTPEELSSTAEKCFRTAGFSVMRNYPYEGTYVPNVMITGECDGISIMLEFNKRIYCDEYGKPDSDRIILIRTIIEQIVADFATMSLETS